MRKVLKTTVKESSAWIKILNSDVFIDPFNLKRATDQFFPLLSCGNLSPPASSGKMETNQLALRFSFLLPFSSFF